MLELHNLEVAYGAVSALRGISLNIQQGEVVALLGANGAGKSTTLRAISGLIRPKAGEVRFEGQALKSLNPTRIVGLGIAHCPEGRRVFAGLSVYDNLLLGAAGRRDTAQIKSDLEHYLNLFPILRERKNQIAGTLSGGEQQMLALSRALMSRPRLLLLDEPSLGIAPLVVKQIFESLRSLKTSGVTMLLVEQNVKIALSLADRGYVLRNGRVSLEGSAAELGDSERLAQAYLGGVA